MSFSRRCFASVLVTVLDDPRLPFVIRGYRDLD